MMPVSGWPHQPDPGLASDKTPKPGHRRETRHKGCGSHAHMSRLTGAPVLGTAGGLPPTATKEARPSAQRPAGTRTLPATTVCAWNQIPPQGQRSFSEPHKQPSKKYCRLHPLSMGYSLRSKVMDAD